MALQVWEVLFWGIIFWVRHIVLNVFSRTFFSQTPVIIAATSTGAGGGGGYLSLPAYIGPSTTAVGGGGVCGAPRSSRVVARSAGTASSQTPASAL